MRVLIGVLAFGLLAFTNAASADMYLNSAEAQCNGSDPTVLWCDDFEDGYWWNSNDSNNPSLAINDGWWGYCGTYSGGNCVSGVDTLGDGDHAMCGSFGAAGTSCAGQKGFTASSWSAGWKDLSGSAAIPELYVRFYWKPDAGSYFGSDGMNEKISGAGDTAHLGGNNSDIGFLDTSTTNGGANATFKWCLFAEEQNGFAGGGDLWASGTLPVCWVSNNVSEPPVITPGHWYYIEYRMKIGPGGPYAADGTYQLWLDDCGTTGTGCTGAGTLRASHTNIQFWMASWGAGIDSFDWVSLWGWRNETPTGQSGNRRFDQIVAATRRIGPLLPTVITCP